MQGDCKYINVLTHIYRALQIQFLCIALARHIAVWVYVCVRACVFMCVFVCACMCASVCVCFCVCLCFLCSPCSRNATIHRSVNGQCVQQFVVGYLRGTTALSDFGLYTSSDVSERWRQMLRLSVQCQLNLNVGRRNMVTWLSMLFVGQI